MECELQAAAAGSGGGGRWRAGSAASRPLGRPGLRLACNHIQISPRYHKVLGLAWPATAMQRKWRTNRWALDTVLAYPVFRESIPPRDAEYTLADPTDLYAVYTVLHIENKQSELRWSPHGRFYYFLAQWEQAQTADGRQAQQTAAPEGDEDPPPQVRAPGQCGHLHAAHCTACGQIHLAWSIKACQTDGCPPALRVHLPQIVPEGSEAALRQEAEAAAAAPQQQQQGKGGSRQQQQQQKQKQIQQQQGAAEHEPPQQSAELPSAGQQPEAAAAAAAAGQQPGPAAAADATEPPAAAAAAALPPKQRTQIVVPVSSSHPHLTPQLLQRLFSVRGVQAQQLLLALVDSNGVVTRRWVLAPWSVQLLRLPPLLRLLSRLPPMQTPPLVLCSTNADATSQSPSL